MSGEASARFRTWLSTYVRPALGERGYSRSGSSFHRRSPEGWGVVNFQRSQFGDSSRTRFTVNLGATLDRLSVARGEDPERKPAEHRCVWRCRLGLISAHAADHWWTVDDDTDLPELATEVLPSILDLGLPLIDERSTTTGFLAALDRRPLVGQIAGFTHADAARLLREGR